MIASAACCGISEKDSGDKRQQISRKDEQTECRLFLPSSCLVSLGGCIDRWMDGWVDEYIKRCMNRYIDDENGEGEIERET